METHYSMQSLVVLMGIPWTEQVLQSLDLFELHASLFVN